jgi:hypothetical protein
MTSGTERRLALTRWTQAERGVSDALANQQTMSGLPSRRMRPDPHDTGLVPAPRLYPIRVSLTIRESVVSSLANSPCSVST